MTSKLFNFRNLTLLTVIIGAIACEGRRSFPDLVETGVIIEDKEVILVAGDTVVVNPRFEPNIHPQKDYEWELGDPSLAQTDVDEDYAISLVAKESGQTTLKIVSQDEDELSAETNLIVIASAPEDLTDSANLSVNRENSDGPEAGEGSLKLVDGDLDTKYLTEYADPFWMTLELEDPQVSNYYTLTSANDADERDPRDWEIEGSQDGETWETLDERSDQKFDDRNMTREFYFENDTAYKFYRLNLLKNNGGDLFQMSEWRLLRIND